jgi:hypothetical protein
MTTERRQRFVCIFSLLQVAPTIATSLVGTNPFDPSFFILVGTYYAGGFFRPPKRIRPDARWIQSPTHLMLRFPEPPC